MAKVLIIEDDDVIAQGMARHLTAAGFDAVGVANGETGLARLRYEQPDVCVLDLMLPGVDGWSVIEQARGEGIGTPIVVVSARGTEHDRINALELGADDYLVKPFSMKELAARVAPPPGGARVPRASARRARSRSRSSARSRERAGVRGRPECRADTDRVPAQYALALEQGRVLTRDELLQRVWGRRARTVTGRWTSSSASCARRSTALLTHTFIQTRYGVGYKLDPAPK